MCLFPAKARLARPKNAAEARALLDCDDPKEIEAEFRREARRTRLAYRPLARFSHQLAPTLSSLTAQSRDDEGGARGACRHFLRREANTGGKPAYACSSNATRDGRPTPLARHCGRKLRVVVRNPG